MIERDELLKMAREAGFQTGEMHLQDGSSAYVFMQTAGNHCGHEVARLVDIVLERAALACESRMSNAVLSRDSSEFDCEAAGCAIDIRALKTKE